MDQPRNAQLKTTEFRRHVGNNGGKRAALVAGQFVGGVICAARLGDGGKSLEIIGVGRQLIDDVHDATLLLDDLLSFSDTDATDEPDISEEAEAVFRDLIRLRHPEGCPCRQLAIPGERALGNHRHHLAISLRHGAD